jgi:hypothetical protein
LTGFDNGFDKGFYGTGWLLVSYAFAGPTELGFVPSYRAGDDG